jgi:cysteine-rich repeat protein
MSKYAAIACLLLIACDESKGDQPEVEARAARAPIPDCVAPYCSWSEPEPKCARAAVPTEALRPPAGARGEQDATPIYLALSRLSLSGAPDGRNQFESLDEPEVAGDVAAPEPGPYGFDLDGQCTRVTGCEFAAPCLQPEATPMPDGPFCADNAYARLHAEVLGAVDDANELALSEDVINCSLREGRYTQVLRLTGYNGDADDDQVRVDFYASTGLEGRSAASDASACTGGRSTPLGWQPGAPFRILENDLTARMSTPDGLPNSTIVANGFVLDGMLVALVDRGYELALYGGGQTAPTVQFNLQHAVVAGRLIKGDAGGFKIADGAIAGRQAAQDVMRSFEQVGVCRRGDHAALHEAIGEYLASYADITLEPDAPSDSQCDGVSTAFRFEAEAAAPGSIVPERQVLNCCLPENSGRGSCPVVRCGDGQLDAAEACDVAIATGEPGACPEQCLSTDACQPLYLQGDECDVRCVPAPITLATAGDGCCPAGATSTNDDDCTAVCGNGIVEEAANETCDPPETCPKLAECDVGSNFCAVTTFTGSAETCNARCETVSNGACSMNDGCCSPGCDASTDNDCSATCGNGQLDEKETCDGDCPTACPGDDGDACTRVDLIGTAAQCSAQCITRKLTQCADGDGCCPPGCHGVNDTDCTIVCGNSITEPGEECDDGDDTAGDGCDRCVRETPARACTMLLDDVTMVADACLECMCDQCAEEVVDCYATGSEEDQRTCGALAECRLQTWCIGLGCYDGGPCTREVQVAGQSASVVTLISRATNPQHRFGRATNVEVCSQDHCTQVCRK